MQIDLDNLSKDPDYLIELVKYLLQVVQEQQRRIEWLEAQLRQRPRVSEENDGQQLLFEEALAPEPPEDDPDGGDDDDDEEDSPGDASKKTSKPRRRGKRKPPHPDLERKDVRHELPEDDRMCCGAVMDEIGEVATEQLEFVPASFVVLRHLQAKYACRECCSGVLLAPKPTQPIEKGLPGPALLAQVVASKYQQHLPLYRQEEIFSEIDSRVRIPRNSMSRWVGRVADLLRPITDHMAEVIHGSRRISTDDTTHPVLPEEGPKGQTTVKAKAWCYIGDEAHPHNVFDLTARRTRDGPQRALDGYSGYLQADAYTGYDCIYASGEVHEVACWAHTKRKLEAALTHDVRAHEVLHLVKKLYAVERRARDVSEQERLAMRQEHSVPVLQLIHEWIDRSLPVLRPKSSLGQAVTYLRNQWEALCRYAGTGFLEIDNNVSEREMKRVAVGRKNWLFSGHMAAAERAMVLMSLAATCRRHGVSFFEYLRDVIVRIATHPPERIAELTPVAWGEARAEGRFA